MENLDEHEMLIQYSEMTGFDFNSEEFQRVKKDYLECRDFFSELSRTFSEMFKRFNPADNY